MSEPIKYQPGDIVELRGSFQPPAALQDANPADFLYTSGGNHFEQRSCVFFDLAKNPGIRTFLETLIMFEISQDPLEFLHSAPDPPNATYTRLVKEYAAYENAEPEAAWPLLAAIRRAVATIPQQNGE